ncbi:MAG: matrixin family metalloprotease [Lachnospiraceae bacterium]|nr:matrixin family metalloprotease [Lachnospiraceae bacterium]
MKPLIALVVLCVLFLGISITTYAYYTSGYIWPSSTISYYYESYNSLRGKTYFQIGANGWTGTDVNFVSGTAGNHNILCTETNQPKVGWDAITAITVNGKYYTSNTIQINTALTQTYNDDGALRSVIIHEFGHCLGLGDSGDAVIMNGYTWGDGSRYGYYRITTIQADDKNGANALY